jgi:hypothetical protein
MNCCYTAAAIAFALLGGSFATLTVTKEQHNVLRQTFSPELDEIYTRIVKERATNYIHGILLGVVLSFIILYFAGQKIHNRYYHASIFFAITLTTSVFYYMLKPKTDYILNHLKSEEENKAWLYIYNEMKTRYLWGMLLGAAASLAFSFVLC